MPLQEFWNDDPDLLWAYRNLYMQKIEDNIKLEKEMINYKAWLQGFYNNRAVISAFNEKVKYYEQPIELNEKPKTIQEQNQLVVEKAKASAMRIQMLLKQRSEKEGQN